MRALTFVLTVALAALGGSAASGTAAAPSLNTALGNALRSQGIAPTRTAAIVLDVRTGTPVYAFNSTASLLPASVEKLAVSYTALRVLGPRPLRIVLLDHHKAIASAMFEVIDRS